MLAHKVDGENPVTYSELLLAAWKLERWVEAKDPLLPKTTTARSSNVTHSHSQGNLFPSRKLKGSHTFTAQSAAVEDHETEEDSGPKPEGKRRLCPLAEEDMGTVRWGWQCRPIIRLHCMVHQCSRAIPKEELQLLWVWQPRSPGERLPKGTRENHKEGRFKLERWDGKEGRLILSEVGGYPTGYPGWCYPSINTSWKAPFLNPDWLRHWSGPENIA